MPVTKSGVDNLRLLKYLIVLAGLHGLLSADTLETKIKNLIGEHFYQTNRNFIAKIFKNRNAFYIQDRLQIKKVVDALKENGLLPLKFSKPGVLRVSFQAKIPPLLLLKTTQSVLASMGYAYFMVLEVTYKDAWSKAVFTLKTEYALDPNLIASLFAKKGFVFADLKRNNLQDWSYYFGVRTPKLANTATIIPSGNYLDLKEISGEYWLDMAYSGRLHIMANTDAWHPQISFFDTSLHMLDFTHNPKPTSEITLDVPDSVRFIKVSDMENPIILKAGIRVLLEPLQR
ncbi:hypothetical protein ACFOPX_04550 [Helicobacter baculiformis]|uniref:Periplasmic protein n=1 Tax=Helicobacter baculiformis TaxID=427351 RepID=A0ABV7ZJG4_9HELI|nr:hypothetical protein [Helicobacter baculiformis]